MDDLIPHPLTVLLIGGGGREHALAWAMAKSPHLKRLYAAPGNAGIADCADCIVLDAADHAAVIDFCRQRGVDLVVIGPEAPLVAGLADDLTAAGMAVFGPSKAAAQLEGSKGFTKDLCAEAGIPTAAYHRFTDAGAARDYIAKKRAPIVIKADGLAAGKGVVVAATEAQAVAAINAIFDGQFGQAEAVVEEFLTGEEASFFVLCDGETALPLASAQDHKRVGDGDTGPNTGGMGAYSPAPVLTPALEAWVMADIIKPTLAALAARGTPYRGVLYAGLMLTDSGPQLIEYNVRFGDPECQVLMPRLASDALALFWATAMGRLSEAQIAWRDQATLAVVLASRGYPGPYEKGSEIRGLDRAAATGALVFHAGTAKSDGKVIASGGRVLAVTAMGETIAEAQGASYQSVDKIDWPEGFFRHDIGHRALKT